MIGTPFHLLRLTVLQYICRPGAVAQLNMEQSDIPMSKAISGEHPGTVEEVSGLIREVK